MRHLMSLNMSHEDWVSHPFESQGSLGHMNHQKMITSDMTSCHGISDTLNHPHSFGAPQLEWDMFQHI